MESWIKLLWFYICILFCLPQLLRVCLLWQTAQTLMRRCILWHLIWVYTFCKCPPFESICIFALTLLPKVCTLKKVVQKCENDSHFVKSMLIVHPLYMHQCLQKKYQNLPLSFLTWTGCFYIYVQIMYNKRYTGMQVLVHSVCWLLCQFFTNLF